MRVLLFGHSLVRDLLCLGDWNRQLELDDGSKIDLEFLFRFYSGRDFNFFLFHPEHFDIITELNPDIVIVILGGNLIVGGRPNGNIKSLACDFFSKLTRIVKPGCLRFAAQIEPRHCSGSNRFGTPAYEEFNRRRAQINNHYNTVLKRRGLVDHVIFTRPEFKTRRDLYQFDGVHLKQEGLALYKESIIGGIRYALNKRE